MKSSFDGKLLGEQIVEAVTDYVARVRLHVNEKLLALEARIAAIPAGPQGERGEKGTDGKDGAPGERGSQGDRGDPGERGDKGLDGMAGPVGPKGDTGPSGERGEPGPRGDTGPAGVKGDSGERGPQGERGDKGLDGKDGRDGREGKDGRDGKDAADIIPLPVINAERAYAAGTWAAHRGGLWVADKTTAGMDGWRCVMNGVCEQRNELLEDERTMRCTTVLSDGREFVSEHKSPVVLYRGVWRANKLYDRGDEATHDGSTWHCNADGSTQRPGTGSDWTLAVKRGNHGKDGAPGPQGPRGEPGRNAA